MASPRMLISSIAALAVAPLASSFPHMIRQDVSSPINASLPNVTIFATGGTIASQGGSNTQTIGYSVGLGVEALLDAVPEILNISNINGYQVSNVDSGSVNASILLDLASQVNTELAKPEINGVVITHGTDTLEETCFFLDLVVDSSKPVVCAGAMRPATALSADGPLNLLQAVTLASSPNARNRGAMIVLNDRIGSAFYTTKNNANTMDTFTSTEMGQLGTLINQVPYFYFSPSQPMGKTHFNVCNATSLPQVDIIYAYQDMDAELFQSAYDAGAEGIVWAGLGSGGISTKAQDAAESVYNATGIPFVASHRSADGFVPEGSQDFVIAGGFYNPQKARILLQLAVADGRDNEAIKDVFALSCPAPGSY
ncbi:hypothetical protein Q7P37_008146 [Cladosporium fusiforme]